MISNDEATHRSPDAQCDETEGLSQRTLEDMPCKNWERVGVTPQPMQRSEHGVQNQDDTEHVSQIYRT